MNTSLNRRGFLDSVAKMLGGAVLVGTTPAWTFATKKPAIATVSRSTWQMGTLINLTLPEESYAARHVEAAFDVLAQVDHKLSAHQPASALSHLNRNPGRWIPADRDLLEVSRAALHYGGLTEGTLDVSVLPIMKKYGFIPDNDQTTEGSLQALLDRVDYARLHVQPDAVRLDSGGYEIDFGGVAKGYAVDEAVQALRTAQVPAALLEAGGDLFACGRPEPARRWKIGLRDPLNPAAIFAMLEVEDEAVATSGIYAQTRMYDHKKVTHIVDPRTGQPVRHVLSATIVTRSAMAADALATAACVLEPSKARALIEALPETEGFWVYEDNSTYITSGLRDRVTLA